MAYNSSIDRSGASALIPEEYSREIIKNIPASSSVMQLARRLPNVSRATFRLPVLSVLPTAYFVTGDTGLKQSTTQAWENVYIYIEEIAVVVPIPQSVLDDADYDIWAQVQPEIAAAFGKVFDAAVIHGTNKPSSWDDGIVTQAIAASQTVDLSASVDLYEAVMGENGIMKLVEEDGYQVTGHLAALSMKSKYRGLRDANGQPIFVQNMQATTTYNLDGRPLIFNENGGLDTSVALQISGDWSQLLWAVRQDISYTINTQGVITDGSGNTILNLFQQDAIALRAVMRVGWCLPNAANRVQTTAASRFPFGVLIP